ncbi:MAG: hypothetical protein PVJ02_15395 [Gemmatimonadota bacterium]|jgi:predicted esterase
MPSVPLRTFHYIRSWLTGRDDVASREVVLHRGDTTVPATLLTPGKSRKPIPAWIVLHGITRPGRGHGQLVRFTHAVAQGGCAVLVPEVPEWRELALAPGLTVPTVMASLRALRSEPDIRPGPVGLLGFSFGAPQAIAASAHPEIGPHLAGVVGFGGYCDLERTVLFQLTGDHEWNGTSYHLRPDPYGRWIVAANYLTAVPGLDDAHDVAEGLRCLAAEAGDRGIMSWDPCFDPLKDEIRGGLRAGRHRDVFDLFAPPSGREPERAQAEEMGHALAAAARRVDPSIEPEPLFSGAPGPVHLLHGVRDHLIPFTEIRRLERALPTGIRSRTTVTPLFGHSAHDPVPGWWEGAREGVRFVRALSAVLGLV